jgi:hypothetical protein
VNLFVELDADEWALDLGLVWNLVEISTGLRFRSNAPLVFPGGGVLVLTTTLVTDHVYEELMDAAIA